MMRKPILFSFTVLFFFSCTKFSNVPLKGVYQDTPYEIESLQNFDSTWSKIIDLFATKGLSIKLIDKTSGLIVSEKTSFLNNYTFEDKDGGLVNPDAYIVLSRVSSDDALGVFVEYEPQTVTAEWNIRIKENSHGRVIININLTNIDATYTSRGNGYSEQVKLSFTGKSTGNFEKFIAGSLK